MSVRAYTSTLLCFAVIVSAGLACSRRPTPEAAFDHAWETFQNGDLIRAQSESQKAYGLFHEASAYWAWKFTILTSRILYRRGLYNEALRVIASESAPGPDGDQAVRKFWLQGLIETSTHNFSQAEAALSQAEQLCIVTAYPVCGSVPSARGALEMHRGRFGEAQAYFERALQFARASSDQAWEANALLDVSWSEEEQAHFDEALENAMRAREIAIPKQLGGVSQTALGNMGWAYYKLGDLEKAERTFFEAKDESIKLGDVADEVRWLTDLGYVYMDRSTSEAAEQFFNESLALARKINSRADVIDSLIALAFVSEQTGKLDDAKRYADEALSMARTDGNKRDETYPRLVQGRVAAQHHDAATAEAAFHEVAASSDSPVFLKWQAEHSLARLYEDEDQADSAAHEYRVALSTFETARSQLQKENSRLPFLTNATNIYDDYIHFLIKQGRTSEALQVAEYSRARTLSEGLGLLKSSTSFQSDALNAPEIARRAGGSVFFYWLGVKQSYLWVATPQKVALFQLPAASDIDLVVQRYRKALIGPQDPLSTSNSDGIELFETLVAPARGLVPKNGRVFIIPDGSLNTLNFETLLVSEPTPHYWIEDVAVTDASSLRLLATAGRAAKNGHALLLLGNAIAPNSEYPELRKAEAEIDSIEKHFPANQQVITREHATPGAYLESKLERYSYIHFVAHGTASRLNPLDSAIVLSKSGERDDSFKLYARDVIQHPLRADLVTISTCYGAGSRAYSGEGLVGLSWAFLRAGAHNVIGALWEVSDVSTPQLMDQLYGEIEKGQRPDAALRSAKLSMLHSGTAFRKPFYWAPFQLYTGS